MPGWMFHLEPHGDRVIGLGHRPHRPERQPQRLAVRRRRRRRADACSSASPFATAGHHRGLRDPERRARRGPGPHPEGVPRVRRRPRRGAVLGAAPVLRAGRAATTSGGGVQLVEWSGDTLHQARAAAGARQPAPRVRARRASCSRSRTRTSARSRSRTSRSPQQTADLVIGTCVPDAEPRITRVAASTAVSTGAAATTSPIRAPARRRPAASPGWGPVILVLLRAHRDASARAA